MDSVIDCDPNSFFIEDLTISKHNEKRNKPRVNETPSTPRPVFPDVEAAGTYNILPLYNSEFLNAELREYLSIAKNDFLKLRWHRFKRSPPNKTLKLEVFNQRPRSKSPVRPMILTGLPMAKNSTERLPVPTDVKSRQAIDFASKFNADKKNRSSMDVDIKRSHGKGNRNLKVICACPS